MDDEKTDALARKLSQAGEYDSAIALKLLAGWRITGDDCSVCLTQLICNRMQQVFCVACSQWISPSGKFVSKLAAGAVQDLKSLPAVASAETRVDDVPNSLRVLKALPSRKTVVAKISNESNVKVSNLRDKDQGTEGRSPRNQHTSDTEKQESGRQGCGSGLSSKSSFQNKIFCSVSPIVDDYSGPINSALWEEDLKIDSPAVGGKRGSKREVEECSPRAVLDGPDSSVWSERSSSRKSLLNGSSSGEDEVGHSGISHPPHKHCMQSLWRSFASKKWQSFPSSYKKKELSISEPVSCTTPDMLGIEGAPEGEASDQEPEGEFLSVAPNAKRSWLTFSYEEISLATNNFDQENLVGRGGYAKVYKGVLKDGQLIAVKKHNRGDTAAEKERDFLIELGIISHVSHPNVAVLLGMCIENGLHLVFQFSHNGSLQPMLHSPPNSPVLPWAVRFKVAVGVARGLHYLHEQCQRRIIHRDIKASNILLDANFEPQISDFGLSKWLPDRWTHHTVSPIEGTFGYLAPEYFMHGVVDEKTDVFSYGVLLLELITGRRPVDNEKQNLVIWAKAYLEKDNIKQLADRRMGGEFDLVQMHRMVLTARLCVRQSASWRPTMGQVVQVLTEDPTDMRRSETFSRLISKSHDFAYSDTESQEDYGYTDDYENDMQRHRALALEFE